MTPVSPTLYGDSLHEMLGLTDSNGQTDVVVLTYSSPQAALGSSYPGDCPDKSICIYIARNNLLSLILWTKY